MQHKADQTSAAAGSRHASPRSSEIKEQTSLQRVFASQAFWVTVALVVLYRRAWPCIEAEFRHGRQCCQHDPQLRALRHHGARHDGGDHHRRHRSFRRLGHGPRGHRRRAVPHLGISLVCRLRHGTGGRPGLRRVQRFLRRLCRHAVLRGDAGHDVDCPLIGGGVFRQPDALQIWPRCADRQGDRPGEMAASGAGRFNPRLDTANFGHISGS